MFVCRIECFGRTSLSAAVRFAREQCAQHWQVGTRCDVILITDGLGHDENERLDMDQCSSFPRSFIYHFVNSVKKSSASSSAVVFVSSSSAYCQLHIAILTASNTCKIPESFWAVLNAATSSSMDGSSNNNNESSNNNVFIHYVQSPTVSAVCSLFGEMAERNFMPCFAMLKCGQLRSCVQLTPALCANINNNNSNNVNVDASVTLNIIGFVPMTDMQNVAIYSKHIVLALGMINAMFVCW